MLELEMPEVASVVKNLRVLVADGGRHNEAAALFAESLPALEATLAPRDRTTEACAANLAHLGGPLR